MESVIRNRLALRFLHPRIERLPQALAFILNREINQSGCAAESRGNRASLEIIRARCAAKGHIQMRMHINSARQYQMIRSIDDSRRIFDWELRANRADFLALDADIRQICIRGCDHRAIADDGVEAHLTSAQYEMRRSKLP